MFPFPTPRMCPLLTLFMTSSPGKVLQAVSKEKKPTPALTRRLMRAGIWFDKVVEVFDLPQFN
jgi:hypothetical protein